jgi:hypothetical protein
MYLQKRRLDGSQSTTPWLSNMKLVIVPVNLPKLPHEISGEL